MNPGTDAGSTLGADSGFDGGAGTAVDGGLAGLDGGPGSQSRPLNVYLGCASGGGSFALAAMGALGLGVLARRRRR
jgi:uncharacterized protein (TIGR03382 family)